MFAVLRRILLSGLVLLLLSECDAVIDISVTVSEDGSGTIDLVAVATDTDQTNIQLADFERNFSDSIADLTEAGWEVLEIASSETSQQVTVRADFSNPEQFSARMRQLSSDDGLFQDFELVRSQSFGRVEFRLNGVVDSSLGLGVFSDPALEDSLGQSLESLAGQVDVASQDVEIFLSVDLPGQEAVDLIDGPLGGSLGPIDSDDDSTRFSVPLDVAEPQFVGVSSEQVSLVAQVLRGVAVLTGIAAILVFIGAIVKLYRKSKSKRKPRRRVSKVAEPELEVSGYELVSDDPEELLPTYDFMVFDGMGVIYVEPDNISNLLIPFVRESGSGLLDDEIRSKAVQLTQGRITTEQFWSGVGVDGDAAELNDRYLSSLSLSPGIVTHMLALRSAGIKIGCLTNDSIEWANDLKRRHSLSELVDVWVVSGEVGLRKPSIGTFEALRRRCGVDSSRILLVDDELDVCDLAKDYGFGTAWYTSDSIPSDSPHSVLRPFTSDE